VAGASFSSTHRWRKARGGRGELLEHVAAEESTRRPGRALPRSPTFMRTRRRIQWLGDRGNDFPPHSGAAKRLRAFQVQRRGVQRACLDYPTIAEDLGLPSVAFRRLPELRPDGDAWIVARRRPLLPQQAPGGARERGGALGGLPLGGDAGERGVPRAERWSSLSHRRPPRSYSSLVSTSSPSFVYWGPIRHGAARSRGGGWAARGRKAPQTPTGVGVCGMGAETPSRVAAVLGVSARQLRRTRTPRGSSG
jgi:hypothetical protein